MSTAVLLTCHGTVEETSDLPAFLSNIRRGRPTPPAIVEEVKRRLEHIGGSPLMRITAAQASALSARLGIPVRFAGRLWGPYPREVIAELVERGATLIVSIPLAPQSVEIYDAQVREAVSAHPGLELRSAPPWGLEPALIDAFVESIEEAIGRLPEDARARAAVMLTAHSLPQRVIDAGDLYEKQFRAMADRVAARVAAHGNPVRVAFQSQGMDGGAWLGPDLRAVFAELAGAGTREVVIAPIGFVSDHTETLYDLDVEAPKIAAEAGIDRVERAAAMNTRPRFIDALESVARKLIG